MSNKIPQAFGLSSPDLLFKIQTDYDFWQASRAKRKKIPPIKTRLVA